uniref:Uncharacterized protein n=1 Tax=Vespula pensylvanica TaxID=30213 RepID=A0A834P0R3_VESPE|nr:hypothetical protein H0235_008894 [Vespula pensylvanica]
MPKSAVEFVRVLKDILMRKKGGRNRSRRKAKEEEGEEEEEEEEEEWKDGSGSNSSSSGDGGRNGSGGDEEKGARWGKDSVASYVAFSKDEKGVPKKATTL